MAHRFQKHYTRAEARALLPQVRQWLERLQRLRAELVKQDERLGEMMPTHGDMGGELVNTWVRTMTDLREILLEFYRREIQIKDLERGLLDFPALIDDKEVFLCWEQTEPDIDFWHDLDTGYAGRERLD